MKERLLSIGTFLCVALLTALLLVHTLAIFPGTPAMRWFFAASATVLSRLDAPAWVQAVGSILAIVAAAFFVKYQHSLELRRDTENDKKARMRRYLVLAGLARATAAHAEFLRGSYSDRETVHSIAIGSRFYDPGVISSLGEEIAAVPLHEVDDEAIARELLVLKANCRQMKMWVGDMLAHHSTLNADDFAKSFQFLEFASMQCARSRNAILARVEHLSVL
ncbi:hypothetical protein ACSFBI_18050 [Variovorax sp. RB3P1]|uniref:hypothetical protein n=1 Tax=Variovorax sp. RB3P1 TaxID=3443732 RepID=UPI003F4553B0